MNSQLHNGKQAEAPPLESAAREALQAELKQVVEGEVRFDALSRALYSTDASVYQIEPVGVVIPRHREDVRHTVRICARAGCSLTVRGGGTSQAGQAIGAGLQLDTSKYLNRILELNAAERWVRVEPGAVLDELNAWLRPHGLMFAPDVSTSNRATVGGMMANNSSGARSLVYGKTIDHVLEQTVVMADGNVLHFRPLSENELETICASGSSEARLYSMVRSLASECAGEIERRFPRILRRVGGYNLDRFTDPRRPFNLCELMVGSEGTLGVIVEAKLNLVPLPAAKSLLVVHFADLLEALSATPFILGYKPVAVEVMDRFILDHTRRNPALNRMRHFIQGDPGAILLVEFYAPDSGEAASKLGFLQEGLREQGLGYHCHAALDSQEQARIWSVRKAALGLSMAMRGDAKAISFVEDTAVAPEKLRDYIERFLGIVEENGTEAGVYAHASVGCLHVRPVINLKTHQGVRQFETIAAAVADLVLEFGGALSGEHGDGLVRSPFLEKMFGSTLYQAFRTVKQTFDPLNILNPGKIVDAPPLTAHLRYGPGYLTPDPKSWFDFSEFGGWGRAVEMCSGVGACRKKTNGTMCPSYRVTREETDSTRGRANVLRLAMNGRLGESVLGDQEVKRALDLCLECRACRSECPVGVDMARLKSEFLAQYQQRHGITREARFLGRIHSLSVWGSRLAPLSNWLAGSLPARRLGQYLLGLDARRSLPAWRRSTPLTRWRGEASEAPSGSFDSARRPMVFLDTFTRFFDPHIGRDALELLAGLGLRPELGKNVCCGRPLISQGLLGEARELARRNSELLVRAAESGRGILFLEPSCLSAVREDAPQLLRGEEQERARRVGDACLLVEDFLEQQASAGRIDMRLSWGPRQLLLHGHCHQKAMGLVQPAASLLSRIPGCRVEAPDTGCCGMAGSFGYLQGHYEISRQVGELQLFPAIRQAGPESVVIASGTSCRHQIRDLLHREAVHPVVLLRSLLQS